MCCSLALDRVPCLLVQVLDQEGVGELVRFAVERGRAKRPSLKIGICGEQVRWRCGERASCDRAPWPVLPLPQQARLYEFCVWRPRALQGGEPKTVSFLHQVGLDYVSCSPFRVPIARLAAAQAAVKAPYGGRKA